MRLMFFIIVFITFISCKDDNPNVLKLKFENHKNEIEKFCSEFLIDTNMYVIRNSEDYEEINLWARNYYTRNGLKLGDKWLLGKKRAESLNEVLKNENISSGAYDSCISFLNKNEFVFVSKKLNGIQVFEGNFNSIILSDDSDFYLLIFKEGSNFKNEESFSQVIDTLSSNIYLVKKHPQPL